MQGKYESSRYERLQVSHSSFAITVNPQNHEVVPGYCVHRNINITNNTFKVYDAPLLIARSTRGLVFANKKIEKSDFLPADKTKPAFNFTGCTEVKVSGNRFYKDAPMEIKTNGMSSSDIKQLK